jgi:hypothetical protein
MFQEWDFSEIQTSHEKKGKVVSDCFSQETVCLQILINFSWIFLSTPATRICLNNVPVGEGEGVPEPAHLKIYMGKRRGLVYLYRTELPEFLKTCLLPLFPLYSLVWQTDTHFLHPKNHMWVCVYRCVCIGVCVLGCEWVCVCQERELASRAHTIANTQNVEAKKNLLKVRVRYEPSPLCFWPFRIYWSSHCSRRRCV